MTEYKVRGVVIREDPMGDKDKRVVLLTEEMGKITVLAKGAMGPKSKYASITQLFSLGSFVLTKGKTFYYIKEAALIESFYGIRQDLWRLSYASLMVETAEVLSLEGQENSALVHLLIRGLLQISHAEEGKEALPADVFIFRSLTEGGYYPELNRCRRCGADLSVLSEGESVVFDVASGGILCERCLPVSTRSRERIHSGALRALRYVADAEGTKVYSFTVNEDVLQEMNTAVSDYLIEQTEHRFRGLEFIDKLMRDEG